MFGTFSDHAGIYDYIICIQVVFRSCHSAVLKCLINSFRIGDVLLTPECFYKIFHIDLYRLESSKEVSEIGIEEYFDNNGITIIEWPEKITKIDSLLSQEKIKKIYIDHIDENKRKFTLSFNL